MKAGQSIVTVMTTKTQYPEDSPNVRQVISPHVRAGIQDSLGFWIPRRRLRIPGTRFQPLSAELGFWIPVASEIPDPFSCIPDSKAQDSGFNKQQFSDCGIRIPPMFHRFSLHRSINMDNSSIVGSEFTFFMKKSHQFAQEYIKADDVTTVTTGI